MQLELTIKRLGGTVIQMPNGKGASDTTYHFLPDATGAHVAEVDNPEHLAMFLRVPEYKPYGQINAQDRQAVSLMQVSAVSPEPAQIVSPATDDASDPLELDQMDRPQLMGVYQILMGEKAHPAIKIDTLRARITEKIAADEEAKAAFNAEAARLGALAAA